MSESNTEINYKEAYEREHEKCADLADKIVVLESEKEDLQFKLDRIKKINSGRLQDLPGV